MLHPTSIRCIILPYGVDDESENSASRDRLIDDLLVFSGMPCSFNSLSISDSAETEANRLRPKSANDAMRMIKQSSDQLTCSNMCEFSLHTD